MATSNFLGLTNPLNTITQSLLKKSNTNPKNATVKTPVSNTQYSTPNPKYTQVSTPVQTQQVSTPKTPVTTTSAPRTENPQYSTSRFIGFQPVANNAITQTTANVTSGKSNLLNTLKEQTKKEKEKIKLDIPTKAAAIKNTNSKNAQTYINQVNVLKDLQADMYKNNGPLRQQDIMNFYPELSNNLDRVMELQSNLRPIVKNGEYVEPNQISTHFPDILQKSNISTDYKIAEENARTNDKENKKIFNNAKKVNQQVLSANGKDYANFMVELSKVPGYMRSNYKIDKDVADSEILSYVLANYPEYQQEFNRINNLQLTDQDKAYLGIGGNRLNQFNATVQKAVDQANTWYQQNVSQPLSDVPVVGGVANTAGTALAGANKILTNQAQLAKGEFNSLGEIAGAGIKTMGGALNTVFGTAYAPLTAAFDVVGQSEIGRTIEENTIGLVPRGITYALESTPLVRDFYNSLDDEAKADLANELTIGLLQGGGALAKKTGFDIKAGVAAEALSNALQRGKYASKFQIWLEKGMADESGRFQKGALLRVLREGGKEFESALKENMSKFDEVVKARQEARNPAPIDNNNLEDKRSTGEKVRSDIKNKVQDIKEKASEVVDTVKEKANEAANVIKEKASEIKNKNNTPKTDLNVTEATEKPGVVERVTDWGARKITGTTEAQDKLYKAQEPRMNVLSNRRNLEQRRANSDRANELIVENGYTPTDTTTRLKAHEDTMKNIWSEIESRINNSDLLVDKTALSDALDEYIAEQEKLGSTLNQKEINALKQESQLLRGQITDLMTLEKQKQLYNSVINNWGDQKVSDTLANGLRVITKEIGKLEDIILSKVPGEFTQLKKDFGALKDTYEDVFKADMKNQRKKGSGLTETYSRIEGVGDLIEGVFGLLSGNGAKVVKGAGKILLGKSLAKASNNDFLIKEGFKELKSELEKKGVQIKKRGDNKKPGDTEVGNTKGPKKPNEGGSPKNKVTSKTPQDNTAVTAKKDNATTRFQKGKSLEKDNKNVYNTTTKSSSLTSPGNIRASGGSNTPIATTFSKGLRKIIINGKEYTHTPGKYSFVTNHVFKQTGKNAEYVKNFNEALSKGDKFAVVGNDGGHDIKLYFNKNFGDHFVKHGGFPIENLVETLNKFDSKDINNGKFIYQKQLPNGKRLRAIVSKNYSEISFFESKTQWKPNAVTGKKTNATDGGLSARSKIRFQKSGKTTSKEFKDWFGDWENDKANASKVVDNKGNPLRVYHGTDAEFNTFGNIKTEPGYWFTEEADYAKSHTKNGNVKEVYLSIKKPLNFEDGRQEKVINSILKDAFGEVLWDDEHIFSKEFRNVAKAKGYDGIIFDHSGKNTYIAFEPNQIKSATDNIGTFDKNNPDIRFQKTSTKDSSGKTLSEGQREYFDGSKVVDKDGNLLRVYHGTRKNFTVFDNKKGKFSSNGMAKLGNWFTPSKEGAKQWAKENSLGVKPKAMEGYLDIKNPKIYEKWDATEHLKNVENDRQKLIKDSWKLLDSTGYNQLNKERYKKYFDKDYKHEGFGSKEQEQNKLIEQELKTLAYLSNDYIIEYKSQSYGTDGYQMVKNMREKGLSNEQIIKKANEAKEMLDRLENIRQEHRKGSFTDAYELFENDLRSYGGQTIKDRVGGSWMAMDDEAGAVKKYVEALKEQGYDGIIIKDTEYDGEVFGKTNDQYVAFDSNQFKNIDNKNPTKNEDIRFQQGENIGRSSFTEKSLNKAIENMKKTGLAKDVKTVDTVSDLRKELKGKISKSDLLQVDGEIAGCTTPDGTVYLVKEFLRDDTLKHEFAHRFRSYAEENNPELFKAINKVAEEAPTELKERIKRDYGELSDDALLDEVFAWKQGEFKVTGAELKWYQKMWKAIEELWNSIKSKFGKNYADLSAFDGWEKMSSEQIMSKINDILENGKKVGKPKNLVTNKRLREQAVWHGSPYEFDKFDSSHMGEGEGAQAHGWGHYVAVDKDTGKRYAGLKKSMNTFTYKGKEWNRMTADGSWQDVPQLNDLVHEMQGYDIGFDEAKQKRLDYLKNDINNMEEWLKDDSLKEMHNTYRRLIEKDKQGIKDLEKIKKSDFDGIDRNLYELDIPDPVKKNTPTGKNYLDEGKIIRKGHVDKFLNAAKEKLKPDEYNKLKDYIDKWNINGGMITEDLYSALDNSLGGQKQASKFLESLGYDGIHYFGGQDGEAYVIFNDDALKINSHTKYQKTKATGNSKNRVTSK